MDHQQFRQWIERIYRTAEHEIGCDQLQELLPTYTDMMVQGTDPETSSAEIYLHLVQCPDCADVYLGLHRVADLEARGTLPSAAELLADLAPEPVLQAGEKEEISPTNPISDRTKVLAVEAAPLDLFPTNPG